MNTPEVFPQLAEALTGLDASGVRRLVEQALAAGLHPAAILRDGLSRGMHDVGQLFNTRRMFMPELLVACEVYLTGLELLRPHLAEGRSEDTIGTMVIGSIHGDVHTVGKQVAIPVFEANGLRVIDLGVNEDDEVFVDAIRKYHPQIVGIGTYMTATFMHTKETVAVIEKAGLRDRVKIICGGPAVDPDAARRMGADDASDDAWEGVTKIKRLLATRTAEHRDGEAGR